MLPISPYFGFLKSSYYLFRISFSFLFFFFTECPSPRLARNADLRTEQLPGGVIATYTCWHGYRFPDDSTVRTAVCGSSGVWSVTPSQCHSETVSNFYHWQISWILILEKKDTERVVYIAFRQTLFLQPVPATGP